MKPEHKFPYKWYLKDGYPSKGIAKHGLKVFGTFICGGGSTMGYKLAGYDHLGGVEIDPKVASVYKANHNPKHLFVEDIRLFNKRQDLPAELFNLDILDGSPPCSSFSMAGNRDKDWGKKKQFREGQELQRLDDLVFEYVETIGKLRPKVALLENVKGLIIGNAKAYAKEIKKRFEAKGYRVQLFLLNAASMGVPQKRERVFFIGLRDDFELPELKLKFDERAVTFEEVETKEVGKGLSTLYEKYWHQAKGGEPVGKFQSGSIRLSKTEVCPTITCSNGVNHCKSFAPFEITDAETAMIGTFPIDYNCVSEAIRDFVGMSVPPRNDSADSEPNLFTVAF